MATIAGHKINNWWLLGGGAGLVLVIYLYRRGSAGGGSGANASAIDPITGLPYSQDAQVDPLTGMTYLAEAQQYGSVSAAEAAISSGSAYGAGFVGSGGGGSSNYSGTAGYPTLNVGGSAPQGNGFATNSQWSQAVTTGLVGLGYSATDVAAALGLYFQSQPLGIAPDGVSYATIIQAAVAEFGPPPVGTFQIIGAPTSGGTGSGSGGGGTGGTGSGGDGTGSGSGGTGGDSGGGSGGGTGGGTTTPPPSSGRLGHAPTGVHLTIDGKTGVRLQWTAVPGATSYTCLCKQGGANGANVNGPFNVSAPVCNFGNLKSKTHYTALIWPGDQADPGGPGSNEPHVEFGFTTP